MDTRPQTTWTRLALTAALSLTLGVTACAGSGSRSTAATSAKRSSPTHTSTGRSRKLDPDQDNDLDQHGVGPLDTVLDFGREASASERRAVTTLVRRYYAAALAGNGATGCTMLAPELAESAAEDYAAPGAGPRYLLGAKTCREILSRVFRRQHSQIAAELPHLNVTHVRVHEHHGQVVIDFAPLPTHELDIQLEGHTWRVDALLDRPLR